MSNFEYYLQDIANDISSPNGDLEWNDFVAVKNYVLHIMRMKSTFFRKICQQDVLFGSVGHNVRIYNDNEFDVLMDLRFPNYNRIVQHKDPNRPGYVHLDFSQDWFGDFVHDSLTNNQSQFLNRASLKSWLHQIFLSALKQYGNVVMDANEQYSLDYEWRGVTYTIYARSPVREFSIDFIPAVKIERPNSKNWYAIPKAQNGPSSTSSFTFMLSNAQWEMTHVANGGETLRDALRLLQALRNAKNLTELRCYHMVTVAIWKAKNEGHYSAFDQPLSEVFLMLLLELVVAFSNGHLSYLWNPQMNLLGNFTNEGLSHYQSVLASSYNTLKSYRNQPSLSFGRCVGHFQMNDN